MSTWKPKGPPPHLTATELWEARTGQKPIKPENCGHVLKVYDAGRLVGRIIKGKPTPREKIRTSLAGRKQAVRPKLKFLRMKRKRPAPEHVRVARRQGAV